MPTLSLNRKAVRTALTTIALAFAGSAQAALIEVDWQTGGDNALVRDTGTNLEWLDVANTGGLSYDFVSANLGVGGQFEGFRYATPAEWPRSSPTRVFPTWIAA